MKKIIYLLSLLVLGSVSLTSCTSNEGVSSNELVTKIVDVAANGDSKTTFFNYNGNNIISTESVDQHVEFNYTNDLITRIIDVNLTTQHQNVLDYTYSNNELVRITSSDNYIMNFVHNSDSTISYEKKTVDSNGDEVLVYHGKLFFENSNLTKDERTMDDTLVTVSTKSSVTYQYDAKNNPFHNITGFTKLLNYFDNISTNNVINGTKQNSTSFLDTDQFISSMVPYSNVYSYNSSDYPTQIVSEKPVFGNGITNQTSSMFYY